MYIEAFKEKSQLNMDENIVWMFLSSSVYLNIFDTNAIKKSKSEELIELSNKCTKIYIRKALIKKPD